MVRPSHPKFMACVLDAVANLGDTRGSSAREVLGFIRQSNVSSKNLTVQVQRALKHAVNAGLLRHRSGRYKVLATLNPTSAPSTKAPACNDQKSEEKKSKPDIRAPIGGDTESFRRTQDRKKRSSSRRRSSRRRSSNTRRKSRRSPYTRRANATVQNRKRRQRKRAYDEEFEDQSSRRYILQGRNESSVPFNRRTKRSRVSKRELQSDLSDESDHESVANRKHISRASNSLRREPKRKETRAKSRGRSASRARTPQVQRMQARQQPVEEVASDDRQECNDEDGHVTERNSTHQETQEDVEEAREPKLDSNSGSSLENS